MRLCSIASGSSGNCIYVGSDATHLLVDVGISGKRTEAGLCELELTGADIDGILITHEHSDHIAGLGVMCRKYHIPVFATKETFDAMPAQTDKLSEKNIIFFKPSEKFCIDDLEILPFSIPHDAANPCGFNIIKDKKHQISIATDIGHMTKSIVNHLEGSEFILLESNYDTEVLKCCSYPFKLKTRIAGDTGHLSNTMAGKTISYLSKNSNLNTAMLGHLSKESNFPELAYQTVIDELIANSNAENIHLSVANRDCPSKLITL